MSGTLEIHYWQMRVKLGSGPMGQGNSEDWPKFLCTETILKIRLNKVNEDKGMALSSGADNYNSFIQANLL